MQLVAKALIFLKILVLFSEDMVRAISSAGLERLPYKEEVTGSTPVSPTMFFDLGNRHG